MYLVRLVIEKPNGKVKYVGFYNSQVRDLLPIAFVREIENGYVYLVDDSGRTIHIHENVKEDLELKEIRNEIK